MHCTNLIIFGVQILSINTQYPTGTKSSIKKLRIGYHIVFFKVKVLIELCNYNYLYDFSILVRQVG